MLDFSIHPLFKLENMLISIENCRDVAFSNWYLTLMLPLISRYDNAPELKALQKNRTKYTKLKVNFAYVLFKNINCAQNVNSSHLEVC